MSWFSDIVGVVGSAVGSTGIPGLSGLGTGLANWANKNEARDQLSSEQAWNAEQAALNRQFQRDERIAAQEFNIDMWNMNNEYNSPLEQLKRAQAAGINPNAVFSDGAKGVASQPVQTQGANGSLAQGTPSLASTILTSDAVVANLLSQAEYNNALADREVYGLEWDKLTAPLRYEIHEGQRDEINARIKQILRTVEHIDFDENMEQQMFSLYNSKNQAEINEINARINQIVATVNNINKDTELKGSQIGVNEATESLIESQTTGQDYANVVAKAKAEIAELTGFPADTPIVNLLYTLSQEGRLQEVSDVITIEFLRDNDGNILSQAAGLIKGVAGAIDARFRGRRRKKSRSMNLLNPQ